MYRFKYLLFIIGMDIVGFVVVDYNNQPHQGYKKNGEVERIHKTNISSTRHYKVINPPDGYNKLEEIFKVYFEFCIPNII